MASKVNFLRARTCVALTAADTDLAKTADAIYVAGAGTIVITDDSDVVTTVTLIAGATFPCIAKRIASASTATGIVALYE